MLDHLLGLLALGEIAHRQHFAIAATINNPAGVYVYGNLSAGAGVEQRLAGPVLPGRLNGRQHIRGRLAREIGKLPA